MKIYANEMKEEEENFTALEIKAKINKFFKENPQEKRIPADLLNEAFRWRLS